MKIYIYYINTYICICFYRDSIEINQINTPEMKNALQKTQTIFALLQISDRPPAIVKVLKTEKNKQVPTIISMLERKDFLDNSFG